jgi:hypothetical protein
MRFSTANTTPSLVSTPIAVDPNCKKTMPSQTCGQGTWHHVGEQLVNQLDTAEAANHYAQVCIF